MTDKTEQYHEEAILYNDRVAASAESLETELKDPEIIKWARAVYKQHRYHEKKHRTALERLRSETATGVGTEIPHADEITIISSNEVPRVSGDVKDPFAVQKDEVNA